MGARGIRAPSAIPGARWRWLVSAYSEDEEEYYMQYLGSSTDGALEPAPCRETDFRVERPGTGERPARGVLLGETAPGARPLGRLERDPRPDVLGPL